MLVKQLSSTRVADFFAVNVSVQLEEPIGFAAEVVDLIQLGVRWLLVLAPAPDALATFVPAGVATVFLVFRVRTVPSAEEEDQQPHELFGDLRHLFGKQAAPPLMRKLPGLLNQFLISPPVLERILLGKVSGNHRVHASQQKLQELVLPEALDLSCGNDILLHDGL